MQQSFLALFCDECGLANDPVATHCSACQQPLARGKSTSDIPSVAPVVVTPLPVREVTPGALFATDNQHATHHIGPGTILADCYQIQEEIGRGGFSIVYRATEVNDQSRQVAIKRIPLSALTPTQVIDATETFNREIAMLTKFSDTPGVPRFYGHLTDQENWYLVMQYIEGETLEASLQKAPGGYFDEEQTISIGIELAQIFNELHTHQPPVIFRDVKPANIMLTPAHELYLIDFGIARNFKWGKARDTTPLGSPGFAAPEQYGRAQTNRHADIYGLGATLQTLVTGRDPLELAAGEPPRNPQPPSLSLHALLDEMLAPDVTQRPVDMRNVQARLELMQPRHATPVPSNKRQSSREISIVSGLLIATNAYIFASSLSTWLGFFLLANVAVTIGCYGKWTEKLPRSGQFVIFIGRETVKYLWIAFVLLWIVLWFMRSTLHLP